uniref:Methyltransferase domain-containing protein n=1 Tax=Meloidogyne enterolobii TaxID=390850 RepID=A0A6V7XKB8_MELEN|nr:unnamed protein product [Meloidogyne enterolobii]
MAIKVRSSTSIKNYVFFASCICFIFVVFVYRSLSSSKDSYFADYYDNSSLEDLSEGLSKLLQASCSKIDRIAEHNICSYKHLDDEKNCLVFSVSKNSDLKFEAKISKLLKKCKIRVYDHGGKGGSDLEVNYKVIKKLSGNKFDEKWLSKILTSEKRKSKINLLRLEVGDQTDKIVQSKILREHSICHLLLTVSGLSKKKLETFVKKMQKSYGYSLYAAYRMGDQPTSINYEESATKDSLDALDEDAVNLLETPKEKKASLKTKREALVKDRRSAGVYTMSFISKNCQKEYGVKWIDQ